MSEIWSNTYIDLHVKYSLFLSDCNETGIFSTEFRKRLTYKIYRKSVQWEPTCSMRTKRPTDMTKVIVAFRNFANAPHKPTPCISLDSPYFFCSCVANWGWIDLTAKSIRQNSFTYSLCVCVIDNWINIHCDLIHQRWCSILRLHNNILVRTERKQSWRN
jgi:hypothetical protein